MSGGTFNYSNHQLSDIAATVQNWIDYPDPNRYEPRPQEVTDLYKLIVPLIVLAADLAHHVDYYEAGDIGEDGLYERCDKAVQIYKQALENLSE